MANDKVYDIVTDKVLSMLDQGLPPWRMPWTAADSAPRNVRGSRYRGVNVWLLLFAALEHGYTEPYWITYKQAQALGGNVRKGESSTLVIFWKKLKVKDAETGEPKEIPMLRYYRVFNIEQCEDVKLPRKILEEQLARRQDSDGNDPIAEAEAIVAAYPNPPTISYASGRAFYTPSTDAVSVPPIGDYAADDVGEYYSTLFHELGHSTGHESRCKRDIGNTFGSHAYGREELVAEMTAAFLCAEAGIHAPFRNSVAYIDGWRRKIKEDAKMVVWAAGRAQMAADHIMNREAAYVAEDQKAA